MEWRTARCCTATPEVCRARSGFRRCAVDLAWSPETARSAKMLRWRKHGGSCPRPPPPRSLPGMTIRFRIRRAQDIAPAPSERRAWQHSSNTGGNRAALVSYSIDCIPWWTRAFLTQSVPLRALADSHLRWESEHCQAAASSRFVPFGRYVAFRSHGAFFVLLWNL